MYAATAAGVVVVSDVGYHMRRLAMLVEQTVSGIALVCDKHSGSTPNRLVPGAESIDS